MKLKHILVLEFEPLNATLAEFLITPEYVKPCQERCTCLLRFFMKFVIMCRSPSELFNCDSCL